MRLGLVSLNQKWLDKTFNLGQCDHFSKIAKGNSCDLAIFPEMTLTGYSMDTQTVSEDRNNSPSLKSFAEISGRNEISLIYGATLSSNATEHYNVLCMSRPTGESDVICEKTHPFSFANEDQYYDKGESLGAFEVAGIRFGSAICYDLRFPEIFSVMAKSIDAFVVIANWPNNRIDHWFALLQARAIENQCFMVGVNRIGVDGNGVEYEESSAVFTPDGIRMSPSASSEVVDIYDIERDEEKAHRDDFPTIKDKRYALYWRLYEGRQ